MGVSCVHVCGKCLIDLQNDTVTEDVLLEGYCATGRDGEPVHGKLANLGAGGGTISEKDAAFRIEKGAHDGTGTVQISAEERAKLIPGNIRAGVSLLGVVGNVVNASDLKPQEKTVTPAKTAQTITPDAGYSYLSKVVVSAIPYKETDTGTGIVVEIG